MLLSILRQMTESHYNAYINKFIMLSDMEDFLLEIMMLFQNLINSSVFQTDWMEMILLQNRYSTTTGVECVCGGEGGPTGEQVQYNTQGWEVGGGPTGNHDVVPEPHQIQCVPDRLDGNDPTPEQVQYNTQGWGVGASYWKS